MPEIKGETKSKTANLPVIRRIVYKFSYNEISIRGEVSIKQFKTIDACLDAFFNRPENECPPTLKTLEMFQYHQDAEDVIVFPNINSSEFNVLYTDYEKNVTRYHRLDFVENIIGTIKDHLPGYFSEEPPALTLDYIFWVYVLKCLLKACELNMFAEAVFHHKVVRHLGKIIEHLHSNMLYKECFSVESQNLMSALLTGVLQTKLKDFPITEELRAAADEATQDFINLATLSCQLMHILTEGGNKKKLGIGLKSIPRFLSEENPLGSFIQRTASFIENNLSKDNPGEFPFDELSPSQNTQSIKEFITASASTTRLMRFFNPVVSHVLLQTKDETSGKLRWVTANKDDAQAIENSTQLMLKFVDCLKNLLYFAHKMRQFNALMKTRGLSFLRQETEIIATSLEAVGEFLLIFRTELTELHDAIRPYNRTDQNAYNHNIMRFITDLLTITERIQQDSLARLKVFKETLPKIEKLDNEICKNVVREVEIAATHPVFFTLTQGSHFSQLVSKITPRQPSHTPSIDQRRALPKHLLLEARGPSLAPPRAITDTRVIHISEPRPVSPLPEITTRPMRSSFRTITPSVASVSRNPNYWRNFAQYGGVVTLSGFAITAGLTCSGVIMMPAFFAALGLIPGGLLLASAVAVSIILAGLILVGPIISGLNTHPAPPIGPHYEPIPQVPMNDYYPVQQQQCAAPTAPPEQHRSPVAAPSSSWSVVDWPNDQPIPDAARASTSSMRRVEVLDGEETKSKVNPDPVVEQALKEAIRARKMMMSS